MSSRLLSYIKYLEIISKIRNTRTRNAVLKDFAYNMQLFDALKEIAVNTINRNVPLTNAQKRKLRRHKKTIIALSKPLKSKNKKKKLIEQSGGFLPILVPIVATLLGKLL